MTLYEQARRIRQNGRHAGHSWRTVYVTLEYVQAEDVNGAYQRINRLRGADSGIPRWLVQRWATDAGLVEQSLSYA